MKKTFCLIFAAVLSLLPMTAISQNLTTEGPFCRQLVGSGIYAVRMSIEVTEDGYLRISLTRAYSENIQAKPSFDFDREWKILNPTSSLPAGMPVKPGMAGVIVSDLENGQSITITKDHELLRGAWTKNGYMTLLEIPYKIGANISTLTSNYLPSFPFDHDKMQCSSVSAIITSETDLLSLCVGSEVTLNAEGFDGNGNFVWERSDSPDGPWEEIPGQNASSIKIVSKNGNEYFKVSQNGTESEPFMLTSVPCCQYTDVERKLWSEDFGTVPKGTRECCDYVKNHTCSRTPSTEIPDGQFAVVSNSDDALDDRIIYNWARNKTDHTGNPDGGFLVVNIGQPVLFYEQEIERDFCENQWYHLSIFACNISQSSGHQAAEFRFEVATTDGQVLAEGETGPLQDWEMENWTNYGISFNSGNYNKFIIRLYSVGGAVNGNDVAIDDMSISVCSPQINLYADIDAGLTDATVDCGSDLTLSITGSDEYLHSIYSNPYVLWQKSTDGGATWTSMEGSGIMVSEMTVTKDDPSVTDYYRAILAGSRELAEEAAATGTLASDCEVFSISNMVRVDCKKVCKVSIKVSDEDICEGDEVTLEATPAYYDSYEWTGPGISDKYSRIQTVKIDKESTYTVKAAGAGCYNIEPATVVLTPYKRPVVNLQSSEIEICEGESITLTASATEADKYELYTNGTISSTQAEAEWQTTPQKGVSDYKVIAYNHGCAGTSNEVQVTTHETIQIEVSPNEATVCKGSEVQITATEISGDPTRFFWNGTEAPNPYKFTANNNQTIEVYAANNYCTSETVESNISVKESIKITLSEVDDICLGESISIKAVIDGSHDGVTWYESDGNGDFVQIPGENGITLETTPQRNGDVEYKISVTTAECPETGATTGIYVHEPIGIALSDSNPTVCEGSEATLAVSTITGNPTRYFWNGTEASDTYTFTAGNDMTIEVFAENDFCKSGPVTASITVQKPVNVTLPELDDICFGDDINIAAEINGNYDDIVWTVSTNGNEFSTITGENGNRLSVTPLQTGKAEYGIEVSSRICGTASDFATLNVNEAPEILQIADNAASEGFVSLVIGNGTPPYSVFLNGQSYGTNTNPGGLQPNTHYNVEISDANGCMAYGEFQTPGMPIDIPLFFSPNGDGINDAWKVDNLETYHGAAIEIYDRFGRKLCTLNAGDDGWDGTYNGHDMPMDDYWYIISIPEENRRLSGHFTLKR